MKGRLLTSLFTVVVLSGLQAQNTPIVPKLVVGLTIDQLRMEYVEAFSTLYGERGFKRLLKDGRIYHRAEYGFNDVDKSSAMASIYTGTTPYHHGVVGDSWLDRNTLRVIGSVDDLDYMGVYTAECSSPVHLKVSNLSDELMIATQGMSEVYSIAPCREMSVLSAGHSSKGAFWINDENGKWSGSTYYSDFPSWVSAYNDRQGLDFRIDEIVWSPYLPINVYHYLSNETKREPFKYKFSSERNNKYRKFKTSPFVNDEVNRLANACFNNTEIGRDQIPDLLQLAYYAGNYSHHPYSVYSTEIQDVYVRLDNALAELLDIIDRKVGLHNTLFFLTSTGYCDAEPADDEKYRIPGGEFHIARCSALLNLYLAAIYGEGQYVEAHNNQEIYLNHRLIEQKQLNLPEVLERSSEFLVQFSGVKDVYSSQRLLLGAWTPDMDKIKNRYNPNCSGDLWIEVLPGWSVVREHSLDTEVVRNTYVATPLFMTGWNVKPETVYTPIKIEQIAPTIAHFMRIRAPNAAKLSPITDILK